MKISCSVYIIRTTNLNIINYCYVVIDNETKKTALIDPSWNIDSIIKVVNNIGGLVEKVFLTHSHIDHINLADECAERFNAQIYMSEIEINTYGFSCKNLLGVRDRQIVNIGKTNVHCISTPGHTAGSMCFYCDGNFFTGDTVFIEGCGMCDFPDASPDDMYHSLRKIKSIIPKDTIIYPAHSYGEKVGKPFRYLLNNNVYFNIDNKEHFIKFRMRKDQKGLFDFK